MYSSRRIIFVAILLGVLATLGVYQYIKASNNTKYTEVWVAKKNIPARTKLESSMVEKKKIAQNYVLANAMASKDMIWGKFLAEPAFAGEQILSTRLSGLDKTKFSYQVPKDKRAITIAVGEVAGVANMIKNGDFVDVVAFFPQEKIEDKSSTTIYPSIAKVVLQQALVLAVDSNSKEGDAKKTADVQRKITLAVSPADAEKLTFSDETAKIRLALRNPDDSQTVETTGAIRSDLVPDRGKKVVSK